MLRVMNKFVSMILLMLTFTLVSLTSCENFRGGTPTPSTDSTYIAQKIGAILNPSFTSVREVVNFQSQIMNEYETDEIFRSLDQNTLINVATVCLNKYPSISKNGIVREYRANMTVYDNLDGTTDKHESKSSTAEGNNNVDTVVEGQKSPVPISVSYRKEIDTINGKPVKILIKEERYEDK